MALSDPIEATIQFIGSRIPLADEEKSLLKSYLKRREVKKGDLLLQSGDEDHPLGFVLKGLCKIYYVTSDGRDFTRTFAAETDVAGDYSSGIRGLPSEVTISALEDSSIVFMSFGEIHELFEKVTYWDRFVRQLVEKSLLFRETRERSMALSSAKERYASFVESYRHLLNRIPNYEIAAFLGITPEALSRIRKKYSQT